MVRVAIMRMGAVTMMGKSLEVFGITTEKVIMPANCATNSTPIIMVKCPLP